MPLKTPIHGSNTMSEHNNDPIVDRVRDGEATGSDLRHINTILPQILDEEGITIHSTDDDIPQIGRVTIEISDKSIMDSEIVQSLSRANALASLEGVEKWSDEWCHIVGTGLDNQAALLETLTEELQDLKVRFADLFDQEIE